jgi:flagellar biosynthesis protein FliR
MSISAQLTTFQASVYNASPTLLPENIASFVTAIALAARLSLRCSSLLIEALLESVKYSTSFSFGVSRQALINALSTAKRLHQLTLPADSSSSEDIDSEK